MSGGSSNSNIPDDLSPIGDLQPVGGGSTPTPAAPSPASATPASPGAMPPPPPLPGAPRLADPTAPLPHLSGSTLNNTPSLGGRTYSAAGMASMHHEIPELTGGRMAAGIGLGVLIGLVGIVAWVAMVYFLRFNFSLIAVGIGWAIGWGVYKGCGQGTEKVCWIGGIIAFIFTGLGAFITNAGSFTAWGIIFSLLCAFFGTRRGYITPGYLAAKEFY